ncbi:MAG TPA: hypothetical protein VFL88_05670 [Gemmatimonadales bacterium]|jgi:hypothetical protein|nr:hypothetical protein [Gemmatimonadales bacterium]
MDTVLAPVRCDLPLVTALALAAPDRVCGVWLDAGRHETPFPVRIASPCGWRTLLIGSDLGALLDVVELALVDGGEGPVLLDASVLRSARVLEVEGGPYRRCLALAGRSPEALLAAARPTSRSRISYLG